MKLSRLRRCAGMRYALLDPILEELAKDGKVKISAWSITPFIKIKIILKSYKIDLRPLSKKKAGGRSGKNEALSGHIFDS
jgi:hypothetical protein